MKVFVTGVCGQLGYDVVRQLVRRGYEVVGSDIASTYMPENFKDIERKMLYVSLDIRQEVLVQKILTEVKPDVVIHCAAWTAVDMAEEKEAEVHKINAEGTLYIAKVCRSIDAKMMYISTDYVFNGKGIKPWLAGCKEYEPLNVYGRTKLDGEQAVCTILEKYFIVRISWVFGVNGNNFVKTMLRLGKKYETIQVVNDQIGRPTYTVDLGRLLVDMVETEKYGVYHATNEGDYVSWYDFACEIFSLADYTTKVVSVTTEEYGSSKAIRPKNSRLDTGKLKENGFELLPTWQDALKRYMKKMGY